ncbi:unnamed protein product [Camellia sinensis]
MWQKCPWFFEKKWSEKMGQIDLFEEEDKRSKWSRILKSLGIQGKFYWGSCTTSVCIRPTPYPMIVEFISRATDMTSVCISIDPRSLERFFGSTAFHDQIIIMHIITVICYRYGDTHTSQNSANSSERSDDKETCKTLSKYMMYLLLTCHSLLPVVVSDSHLKDFISYVCLCFRTMKTQGGGEGREWSPLDMIKKFMGGTKSVGFEERKNEEGAKLRFVEAMDYFYKNVITKLVVEGNNEVKWEELKILWLAMLCYAAISCPKNYHFQKLREGGELFNLVWFLIPQSRLLCGVNTFTLNGFFNKYFQSMPDVRRAQPKTTKEDSLGATRFDSLGD